MTAFLTRVPIYYFVVKSVCGCRVYPNEATIAFQIKFVTD